MLPTTTPDQQLTRKTSGVEMPNQRTRRANMVENGTAPDDCSPHRRRSRTKKMTNTVPGYRNAVSSVVRFQSSP